MHKIVIIILNSQKLTNASLKPFWTCKTPILVHFWIAQRYAQELSYQACCSERWTIVWAVCKVTFLNSHKCTFPGLNTFATDKTRVLRTHTRCAIIVYAVSYYIQRARKRCDMDCISDLRVYSVGDVTWTAINALVISSDLCSVWQFHIFHRHDW